ncbi:MAG: energy-coupling factor transporter transmembrane component T family protein [Candidatus Helarchaeota archaeon]
MSFIPFRTELQKNRLSKLNPDMRIIIALIIGVSTIFFQYTFTLLVNIFFIFILGLIVKTPYLKIAKRILAILPMVIMLSIFIPFTTGQNVFFTFRFFFWNITLYRDGLVRGLIFSSRMLAIFFIFMVFLSSLSFTEFTRLRIFPSMISGSLLIMFNFIPVFMLQNQRLMESQKLRGKKLSGKMDKMKCAGNILGTTLVKAFEQSEKTFESMRLRGFGGSIKLKHARIKFTDIAWLSFTIFYVIMMFFLFEFLWRIDIWTMIGLLP